MVESRKIFIPEFSDGNKNLTSEKHLAQVLENGGVLFELEIKNGNESYVDSQIALYLDNFVESDFGKTITNK